MTGILKRLLDRLTGRRGSRRAAAAAAFDYKQYWNERYRSGGDSGAGSYGDLAEFKADYINAFLANHPVDTVLEFGCGDGNQLRLMHYPRYLGLDVSEAAVERCAGMFREDATKRFQVYTPGAPGDVPSADLVLCLDVLYHITDDADYRATLQDIFASAAKYAILYTILDEHPDVGTLHGRTRNTRLALREFPEFSERDVTDCPYTARSSASFILLARDSAVPPDGTTKA